MQFFGVNDGFLTEQFSRDHVAVFSAAATSAAQHRLPTSPNTTVLDASGLPVVFNAGTPLFAGTSPARRRALLAKRALDVITSIFALIALLPLMGAIALTIRCTSAGPSLFRQNRLGLDGRIISVIKFRSIYIDGEDPRGLVQTVSGDRRVTPFGRFIRKTSLDELPQLINVLEGSMSLVGPRPHPVSMLAGGMNYEALVPYYRSRLAMKPGLTGWAQANGLRGPTDDPKAATARIEHDIAYIQNFSLWLDIRILARTLRREFISGSGI